MLYMFLRYCLVESPVVAELVVVVSLDCFHKLSYDVDRAVYTLNARHSRIQSGYYMIVG